MTTCGQSHRDPVIRLIRSKLKVHRTCLSRKFTHTYGLFLLRDIVHFKALFLLFCTLSLSLSQSFFLFSVFFLCLVGSLQRAHQHAHTHTCSHTPLTRPSLIEGCKALETEAPVCVCTRGREKGRDPFLYKHSLSAT